MKVFWVPAFIILQFSSAAFGFLLPRALDSSGRNEVLKVIGLGTTSKVFSNPYPLGGWSGVECSLSQEFVPAQRLSDMPGTQKSNTGTSSPGYLTYSNVTFGKGLYQHIDVFMSFSLPRQASEVQSFSGLMRFGLYKNIEHQLLLTGVLHGHGLNLNNEFLAESIGADLVLTHYEDWWSIYTGGGRVKVKGTFVGNSKTTSLGMTSNGETISEELIDQRYFLGVTLNHHEYFTAIEAFRSHETSYGLKFGVRY